MIFRPLGAAELGRLEPLLIRDPASSLTPAKFQVRLDAGEYRPEWIWVAEDDGGDAHSALAAAAIWWGAPQVTHPAALDGLYATMDDRVENAANLLAAAHDALSRVGLPKPPDFHIFLPPDWRGRPDVTSALTWRLDAARRAGLTSELERLRYERAPAAGVPEPAGRLTFRHEPEDEVFVELFTRVLAGTLDATSRKAASAAGVRTQACQDVAFYRDRMPGRRSWWRVAETAGGEPAGFGLPSRNTEFPVVGYLGVLPEHRGRGYVDDILAEVTRILVAEAGATTIHADTDLENRPMAAALSAAATARPGAGWCRPPREGAAPTPPAGWDDGRTPQPRAKEDVCPTRRSSRTRRACWIPATATRSTGRPAETRTASPP